MGFDFSVSVSAVQGKPWSTKRVNLKIILMVSYEAFVAAFGLHDLGLNETQDPVFKNVLCILCSFQCLSVAFSNRGRPLL